jgi:hypothetical protein
MEGYGRVLVSGVIMGSLAQLLSKVTLGMVHDLENGCFIIIKH